MFSYLTEKMGVAADEAEILAEEFSNDIALLMITHKHKID
jgi:hypothetical protein